jgi:predicted dehydrogenase
MTIGQSACPAERSFDTRLPCRFGLVGSGYWASTVHAPGLQRVAGARLVGIWARDPAKTAALAASCGVAAFSSLEAMLDAVDAVSFAVPPDVQETLAPRVLAAERHVMLEKPIATRARAAAAIAAQAEAGKRAGIVFFIRRFVPEIAAFLACHQAEDWREAEVELRSAVFAADSPYRDSAWRKAEGAGVWDVGPHVLSILIPMLGPVLEARALRPDEPFSCFETLHAGGARARVRITLRAEPGDIRNVYRFHGPAGDVIAPQPRIDRLDAFVRAATALVAQIRDPAQCHPCGLALGAETVRVLEQVLPWPARRSSAG